MLSSVLLLDVATVRLIPGASLLVGGGGACVPKNGAGSRKQEVSLRTEQLQQVRCSALVSGLRCVIFRRSERGLAVHARPSSFCPLFSVSSKSLPAFGQGEFPDSKELTPLSERRGRWGGAARIRSTEGRNESLVWGGAWRTWWVQNSLSPNWAEKLWLSCLLSKCHMVPIWEMGCDLMWLPNRATEENRIMKG